jgi:uncharacterized protein YcbK (DUF882 family)
MSANFTRAEFACKCGCGFDTVDATLLRGLQRLRDVVARPIIITSACRCKAHNAKVGGVSTSRHLIAQAADIIIRGLTPGEAADYARTIPEFAKVIEYETFVHTQI